MSYVETLEYLTACPACGSGRIVCALGIDVDACLTCMKAWERLPAGEPYLRDGELMPFRVPCDNCAFRRGSDERRDVERWNELQLNLRFAGGEFYCHKAVPFEAVRGGMLVTEREFDYPKKTKSIAIEGTEHDYSMYDTSRMRLCRGYLNRHVRPRA